MNKLAFLLFPLLLLMQEGIYSQSCRDVSVELKAAVQSSPPQISLYWTPNTSTNQYTVYRKLKLSLSWGSPVATLAGSVNSFTDSQVFPGASYEYKILRSGSNYSGYGYINAGIEIPVVEQRGNIILLVDSLFTGSCASEVARLEKDLEGDGWQVMRHDIGRNMPVTSVKSVIANDYYADPVNTQALFLLGHIPVPYSGNLNPDGHPDHQGAWPADVYYADINGSWTDNSVNNTIASDSRNDNVPGDGKFDQSVIPSDVELQVGRVDFYNLPAFALSEDLLMKNYLDKDHNYRHKVFTPAYRAVIDDNFGYFSGEAFAASAWKNFGPLVDPDNVVAADYFTTMSTESCLWSYGCGGGWYQGSSGVGSTGDFAVSNLQGVFTLLFGSYFGDWDSQNNFLRAPLAQGTMLTSAWSGRPHWQVHPMGLGENIGYCARLTQNNNSLYYSGYGARFVHIALMGDPSLRNDVVAPVTEVAATINGNNCLITWNPSADNVQGYYAYVKTQNSPHFSRLSDNLVTDTFFIHSCLPDTGVYTYMIRASILQSSPSGSYFNLSQGISDTARLTHTPGVTAAASFTEDNGQVTFINTSVNALYYYWIFGDGFTSEDENPVHTFQPGSYTVTLIASNECYTDTSCFSFTILSQLNTIQGVFSYDNQLMLGMPFTSIALVNSQGITAGITMTDEEGHFSFTEIPAGTYSLQPLITIIPGGFNSTDALLAMKHFVHLSLLTGLPFHAADVDGNHFINSLDALLISKRFIFEIMTFPSGDWYSEEATVTVGGAATFTKNFKCICKGDCNGSFIPF